MKLLLSISLLASSAVALNPECKAHGSCVANGLTGFCCPTDDVVPQYLDCCSGSGAECSLYPACQRENLEDFCCPTKEGEMLECCNAGSGNQPQPNPTPSPVFSGNRQCSSFNACNAAGLTGNCCPTDSGMMLNCCSEAPPQPNPTPPPVFQGNRQCSAFSACNAQGLIGNCCPNDNGLTLNCCNGVATPLSNPPPTPRPSPLPTPQSNIPRSCQAYSACRVAGLTGNCCPAESGVFLNCCFGEASTPRTPPPTPQPNPNPTPPPSPQPTPPVPQQSKKSSKKGAKAAVRAADITDVDEDSTTTIINGVQKVEQADDSSGTSISSSVFFGAVMALSAAFL